MVIIVQNAGHYSWQEYSIPEHNGVICGVPHPVASVATYEERDRGVNPISVVTERDWHSKDCGRPVTADSHADPEG